jgi:hypothetical protein
MLNTDLFSPQVRKRMAFEDYKRNLRGVNDGVDFSDSFLVGKSLLSKFARSFFRLRLSVAESLVWTSSARRLRLDQEEGDHPSGGAHRSARVRLRMEGASRSGTQSWFVIFLLSSLAILHRLTYEGHFVSIRTHARLRQLSSRRRHVQGRLEANRLGHRLCVSRYFLPARFPLIGVEADLLRPFQLYHLQRRLRHPASHHWLPPMRDYRQRFPSSRGLRPHRHGSLAEYVSNIFLSPYQSSHQLS